ncbi:MAG: EAL domain-containing protein, partial [Actinomycetota bacterium]|nr:EAL domain-containing protein [Actinomycetota bacterium]
VLGLLWGAVLLHLSVSWGESLLRTVAVVGLLITLVGALVIRRYQARLHGMVETDPLTGLANHRGFHDALGRAMATAKRRRRPLAVAMIDLDNFKAVNDTHGHSAGDSVLARVGESMVACTRDSDVAARIGGEEFALILVDSGPDLAQEIVERVRVSVGRIQVKDLDLSCSAGVAAYPADGEDPVILCQLADEAMYSAKRAGKDRVRRFDPGRVRHQWNKKQSTQIQGLLAKPGAMRAAVQPVISLASGRPVGYEALSRFPELPDRPVAGVFAQASGCGLGPALEAVAISAALEPLGRAPGTHLAINVSPSALSSSAIERALPNDLSDLVIELTEHEVFPEVEVLEGRLRELRMRGAKIAIDDIGAGYAGLKQLMRVRPDIVKLDRDLTKAIHTDPPRMALVESFVRYARRIGAVVCAEGIESLDDLSTLADLDVEWGQGYAIAPPGPHWPTVAPAATVTCRGALEQAMRPQSADRRTELVAGDRRLEHLSARLAGVQSRKELDNTLALIAAELNADEITLSAWHAASGLIEILAETGESSIKTFAADEYALTRSVLNEQIAAQVLVGDPDADPREVELLLQLGHRSLLMVPVIHRGESVGLTEAYRDLEHPWTRTDINRARIISNQFAAVIDARFLEGDRASRRDG